MGIKNYRNRTPFENAVERGYKDIVQLLIKAGYDPGQDNCIYDEDVVDKLLRTFGGEHFVNNIRGIATNPRPMQEICCLKIRELIGRNVASLTADLPLPRKLKNFVSFKHLERQSEADPYCYS